MEEEEWNSAGFGLGSGVGGRNVFTALPSADDTTDGTSVDSVDRRVGVGGAETGDGSDGVTGGQGVEALDDVTDVTDDVTLAGDDVDEQSEPQREPDSRWWFSMCDVSAAAVE